MTMPQWADNWADFVFGRSDPGGCFPGLLLEFNFYYFSNPRSVSTLSLSLPPRMPTGSAGPGGQSPSPHISKISCHWSSSAFLFKDSLAAASASDASRAATEAPDSADPTESPSAGAKPPPPRARARAGHPRVRFEAGRELGRSEVWDMRVGSGLSHLLQLSLLLRDFTTALARVFADLLQHQRLTCLAPDRNRASPRTNRSA